MKVGECCLDVKCIYRICRKSTWSKTSVL